jgi:hypothetical protein
MDHPICIWVVQMDIRWAPPPTIRYNIEYTFGPNHSKDHLWILSEEWVVVDRWWTHKVNSHTVTQNQC